MMQPYYSNYGYGIPVGMPAARSSDLHPEDIEVGIADKQMAMDIKA